MLTEEATLKERTELLVTLWNANKRDEVVDMFTDDGILMPAGKVALHGKQGTWTFFSRIFGISTTHVLQPSTLYYKMPVQLWSIIFAIYVSKKCGTCRLKNHSLILEILFLILELYRIAQYLVC